MSFTFMSLVNPRLDLDLLPQWIAFYKSCHFDRYIITLHDDGTNLYHRSRTQVMFSHAGWETRTIGGDFKNGELQRIVLEGCLEEVRSLDPDGYIVLADSDEFHDIAPAEYRHLAHNFDYIGGFLVDRWGRYAVNATGEHPLDVQYPYSGDIYHEAARVHCEKYPPVGYEPGNWEFNLMRRKILCCKAYLPVNVMGSHSISDPHRFNRYPEDVKVNHYSWRETCLDRMLTKNYYPMWIMAAVVELLGESPETPIGRKLTEKILSEQKDKGWEPVCTIPGINPGAKNANAL